MREEDNLCDVAESYFRRIVDIEASTILRSCIPLLPDVETTASLASRCIEALVWENDGGNVDDDDCLNVVVGMQPHDFQTVTYSLNGRLASHDVLYKLVDLYIKVRTLSHSHPSPITESRIIQTHQSIIISKKQIEFSSYAPTM